MKKLRGKCRQEAEAVAVGIGAGAVIEAALAVKGEAVAVGKGAALGPGGPGLGAAPGLDPDPGVITTTREEGMSAPALQCLPGGVTLGTVMLRRRPDVSEYSASASIQRRKNWKKSLAGLVLWRRFR